VIPFRVSFEPGVPLYEQVVYAAKKAIICGQLAPGEAFPSVRALSKALKINPNTAHKVVMQLVAEGLVEVRPGMNTLVARRTPSTATDRAKLLKKQVESLAVEAKRLGLELETLIGAVREHWIRLESGDRAPARKP
jgi:GntR family transcriptional regulator